MSPVVIVSAPVKSNWMVIDWQVITGSLLSSTVAIAWQEELLPFTSKTVRVTILSPTWSQSNNPGSTARESIPQASFEPLFKAKGSTIAIPRASNWTTISWQRATGGILSSTKTFARQESIFPLVS